MKLISAALVKAQQGFAPALKTSSNPHFKSRYADLSACVEAVIDSLNTNGIMLMQKQHPCDNGVSIETVFVHESGESLSAGILTVPAAKQDPQGYGSALTYARRYSLMAACGIAPEDDDGNAASQPRTPHKPAATMAGNDPKLNAKNITNGVNAGDAPGAAEYLSTLAQKDLDAIWTLLDPATQDALTAAWPKAA